MKTLKDVMPSEFMGCEYDNSIARKYVSVAVKKECDATNPDERWPGTHKNIYFWVQLENGKSVGFNENPGRGWSFPVISYPKNTKTDLAKDLT